MKFILNIKNHYIFLFFLLLADIVFAQNAYELAMQELQKRGSVSCNPDEAYNLIMSRDAGGRSPGLALKVKPTLNPQTRMFVDGLDPELACRIAALMKSDPKIKIIYGYRSIADQTAICGASGKAHGCAKPGRSCHQRGLAADLSFPKEYSRAYRQLLLSKYKLHLAYSSGAHVQCIEHKKASVSSCNFPCAKDGPSIDPNGSGPNATQFASQDSFGGVRQNNTSLLQPSYGYDTPSYANQSDYNYTPMESWEGIDTQNEIQNSTDNWWNEYLGDDTDYKNIGNNTVFDQSASTNTYESDRYTPVLGFTGGDNANADNTGGGNLSKNQVHKTTQNSNHKTFTGDSEAVNSGLIGNFEAKNSILDYLIVDNNITDNDISSAGNKSFIDKLVKVSGFDWLINDDARRARQGVNQDIYYQWQNGNSDTDGDFADKVAQIKLKENESRIDNNSFWVSTKQVFAKTFDISVFFAFPTLPIFSL